MRAATAAPPRWRDRSVQGSLQRWRPLRVPWGYVAGVQCDPVEKKPFFHAYPGALAYSFGMLGCDLHCSYCQNWVTSQALRDPDATAPPRDTTPESLVQDALRQGARIVVSTYNEPLITAEWGVERLQTGARTMACSPGFVSNGNGTERVLEYLRPFIDLYKVDLKSFRRPALSRARRPSAADPRHHHLAARVGRVGRDRDAAHPRVQRQRGRIAGPDALSRRRLTGHPVARDGVPSGLQDAGRREHDAGHADARRRYRSRARACASSTRATCPGGSEDSKTRAATPAASGSSRAPAI